MKINPIQPIGDLNCSRNHIGGLSMKNDCLKFSATVPSVKSHRLNAQFTDHLLESVCANVLNP